MGKGEKEKEKTESNRSIWSIWMWPCACSMACYQIIEMFPTISYGLGVGEMGFLHDELLNSNFAMDDGITSVLELLDLFCSWICFARAWCHERIVCNAHTNAATKGFMREPANNWQFKVGSMTWFFWFFFLNPSEGSQQVLWFLRTLGKRSIMLLWFFENYKSEV